MPDVIRGFIEDGVVKKYDYESLANIPELVHSVNGKTGGDVTLAVSDLENDADYITPETVSLAGEGFITDDQVRAMLDVAETWFNEAYTADGQNAKVQYRAGWGPFNLNAVYVQDYGAAGWGPTESGPAYLVCSSFCQAVMNGITFENSRGNKARYYDEDGNLMRGLPYYTKRAELNALYPWGYQYDATYEEYANSRGESTDPNTDEGRGILAVLRNRYLLTFESAHYAYDHGFGFNIGDQDLRPGDFVYVAGVSGNFMNIGHIALVVQVSDDQSTVLVAQSGGAEDGGGMKKDGKHVGVMLSVFPTSHYVYAARFPLGTVPKKEPELAFADKSTKTTGTSVSYTYYTRDSIGNDQYQVNAHAVTETRAAKYNTVLEKGIYTVILDADDDGSHPFYCVASHGDNIKRRYPTFFKNGNRKVMTIYIEEPTDSIWLMNAGTFTVRGITICKGFASATSSISITSTLYGRARLTGNLLGTVNRRPNKVVTLSSDSVTPLNNLHTSMPNFSDYIATVDGYTNTGSVSSWTAMPGRAVWFLSGRRNYEGQGQQIITSYFSSFQNRMWIRTCINSTWTSWVEIGAQS